MYNLFMVVSSAAAFKNMSCLLIFPQSKVQVLQEFTGADTQHM